MISGALLYWCVAILTLGTASLARIGWALGTKPSGCRRSTRTWLTLVGTLSTTLAVGSLLLLHLTWISPIVSQYLGVRTISILSGFYLWPGMTGLIFCCAGIGKSRFAGIAAFLITGFWYLNLVLGGAISMGSVLARHPIRFLIPNDYVGKVEILYGRARADALPMKGGVLICQIPANGRLETSSSLEDGWAKDEYFYYESNGALYPLKFSGSGEGGVIWHETNSENEQSFFVGTEQQSIKAPVGSQGIFPSSKHP